MTKRHPDTGEAMTPIQLADFIAYEHRIAYQRQLQAGDDVVFRAAFFDEMRTMLSVEHDVMNEANLVAVCERHNLPRRG